jgi:uncharacterized protein YqeY
MSLQDAVMTKMKEAMRAKDTVALSSLRAIKSALLLAQTDGSGSVLSEADEIKIVQKLVKQRQDSAAIYKEQGREDLAQQELDEVVVLAQFLPAQLSEEEVKAVVVEIIAATGAKGMQDMGKVMGQASGKLAGKADGKTISTVVKALLNA